MLVRHIAGVPSATEQRCIRCCEVIAQRGNPIFSCDPFWPGAETITNDIRTATRELDLPHNCKPVDLNEREVELRGVDRPNIPLELL